MPARLRRDKRRRRFANITPEAVALFRRGLADPQNRDLRIALAVALSRSKFRGCPIDPQPRSLIGGDREPVSDVLDLRAQLLKRLAID